jgi:hypothetical protein
LFRLDGFRPYLIQRLLFTIGFNTSISPKRRTRDDASSRSPYISGFKIFDLPRGPDRGGVVCLAIIVLIARPLETYSRSKRSLY